jgi:hypothetical protein
MALLNIVARMRASKRLQASAGTWGLVCGLLLVGGRDGSAQMAPAKEYQVKSVFLFNFAQFVTWPSEAFSGARSPILIGVLGDDPFGRALDDVVMGEAVMARQLVVERFRRVEDIKTCHILFISPSEADKYEQIFAGLRGRSILTVGDTDGFSNRGGMIRFRTEQNRIRLRVNVAAAQAAGLTISSQLLRAAELVAPVKP